MCDVSSEVKIMKHKLITTTTAQVQWLSGPWWDSDALNHRVWVSLPSHQPSPPPRLPAPCSHQPGFITNSLEHCVPPHHHNHHHCAVTASVSTPHISCPRVQPRHAGEDELIPCDGGGWKGNWYFPMCWQRLFALCSLKIAGFQGRESAGTSRDHFGVCIEVCTAIGHILRYDGTIYLLSFERWGSGSTGPPLVCSIYIGVNSTMQKK